MDIEARSDFPRSARSAAFAKVDRLAQMSTFFAEDRWQAKSIGLSLPHRYFGLSAEALRGRASLHECVEERGWRFLLLLDHSVVAAVQSWYERSTWHVSAVRTGAAAYGMKKALERAIDDQTTQGSFEPCYLWCRTTLTAALWLRPDSGTTDGFVVPLPFVRAPLKPYVVIPAADFLAKSRVMATPKE